MSGNGKTGTHLPIIAMADAADQELELFFVSCWSHFFKDLARIVELEIDKFDKFGKSDEVDKLDEFDRFDKEHNG